MRNSFLTNTQFHSYYETGVKRWRKKTHKQVPQLTSKPISGVQTQSQHLFLTFRIFCVLIILIAFEMEWSVTCATMAYIDALQLCNNHKRQYGSWAVQQQGSNEFVSALAAGMKAKLIVEVTPRASPSTIALAAAARQTGGRLVCILPEMVLDESKEVISKSGLKDQVEFRTEDPSNILPYYENVDFSLVDCKDENYVRLLNLLDLNPMRSVVVASNLVGKTKGLGGYVKRKDEKVAMRSLKHPMGKGMEVTMLFKNEETDKRAGVRESSSRKMSKSNWVAKFDEESGEEHIFRVPQVDMLWN